MAAKCLTCGAPPCITCGGCDDECGTCECYELLDDLELDDLEEGVDAEETEL